MKSIFEETPVNRYLDVLEEDSIEVIKRILIPGGYRIFQYYLS